MDRLDNFLNENPGKALLILLLLAVPAFFINLGLLPLSADEPTRANVAMEMILTGNYSVPTVGGEYYYNKPPVYNWILAACYLFSGGFSEFTTRLPALVPLFLFSVTIYFSVNYFLKDKRVAALSALLSLLNGRMLIYDSMLGHIDIFYSWLTYSSFMLIFYCYRRGQWFRLFIFSYLITAITFLCKGLPSLLFQGFTLIALCLYTKNVKKLFSWQHLVAGIICLLIIGAYFSNYYRFNPDLRGYLYTIWDQSSKRTASEGGFPELIRYILLFPFEHAGHLFPASLLLLFCFNRNFVKGIKENPFLKFIVIVFLSNIWVYWLSPQTRPRYLLMLYPLLFIAWSHAYYRYRERLPRINRAFEQTLLVMAILVTASVPAAMLFDLQPLVSFFWLKMLIIFICCGLFTWLIYRLRTQKILAFAGLLIIVRLAFSWFVLPHRLQHSEDTYFRAAALETGRISFPGPVFFYKYHPEEHGIPFHDRLIFYIQRTQQKPVKFTETDTGRGYYFTFDRDPDNPSAVLVKSYRNNLKLFKIP